MILIVVPPQELTCTLSDRSIPSKEERSLFNIDKLRSQFELAEYLLFSTNQTQVNLNTTLQKTNTQKKNSKRH